MRIIIIINIIIVIIINVIVIQCHIDIPIEWNTYYIRQQTSLVLWQKPEKLVVNTHRLNQSFFP